MFRKHIVKGRKRILAKIHGWGPIFEPHPMQAHGTSGNKASTTQIQLRFHESCRLNLSSCEISDMRLCGQGKARIDCCLVASALMQTILTCYNPGQYCTQIFKVFSPVPCRGRGWVRQDANLDDSSKAGPCRVPVSFATVKEPSSRHLSPPRAVRGLAAFANLGCEISDSEAFKPFLREAC